MTVRDVYNALLIELNKVNAPSCLLGDFNYHLNKAIQQYVNKAYATYDINQQSTDSLSVLKFTVTLEPKEKQSTVKGNYSVLFPDNYFHLLNCICEFDYSGSNSRCHEESAGKVQYAAKRLTSDAWTQVLNDYYTRPTPKRPYYYIHNLEYKKPTTKPGFFIKEQGDQLHSEVEIRCGFDNKYKLTKVYIDYLKKPRKMELTQEQLDLISDTSEVMEFPDYVNDQIINELTMLVMEHNSDQRLQSHIPVTQSIAGVRAQTPQQAG